MKVKSEIKSKAQQQLCFGFHEYYETQVSQPAAQTGAKRREGEAGDYWQVMQTLRRRRWEQTGARNFQQPMGSDDVDRTFRGEPLNAFAIGAGQQWQQSMR